LLRGRLQLRLPPLTIPLRTISWFVYVVRLGMEFTQLQRDWIVGEMRSRGIGVGRYFAPIHLQPIYRTSSIPFVLPFTENIASRTLALPFFNQIQEHQVKEACATLTGLVESSRAETKSGLECFDATGVS